MPIVGTLSNAVNNLEWKAKAKYTMFNKYVRKGCQQREDIGDTIFLEKMQQLRKRKIGNSFISNKIEYLSGFDMVV